jgi:DNA repair protein SbcC/Rad50
MTPLRFSEIAVRRMPGIEDGGFALDGLAPGINVIHGPNGSGKTTTARAVEAALWPAATASSGRTVSARAWLDGAELRIDLEGRQCRYQRDGLDADPPTLAPAESRDRYRLSLHELLAADDAGFARAVARESAGGYDLAAAARALEPRITPAPVTRARSLTDARGVEEGTRREQQALFAEEQRLQVIERELQGRQSLERRLVLIDAALEHGQRVADAAAAEAEVARFDERVERLLGDEAERVRELDTRLAKLRDDRAAAERALAEAEERVAAAGLPAEGLPGTVIPELRERLDSLRAAQRERDDAAGALARATTVRDAERARLTGALDDERLAAIDVAGVAALGEFVEEADTVHAECGALRARLAELDDAGAPVADREALEHGARLLRGWLRAAPAADDGRAARLRTLGIAAAAVQVVGGLLLALVAPALALVALVGVVLLFLIIQRAPEADARAPLEAEYARLGVAAPAEWSDRAVEAELDRLGRAITEARLAEVRATLRSEAERKLRDMAPREREVEARREEIVARLGADPGLPPAALGWLLDRIGRWQSAEAEAGSAAAALREIEGRLVTRLHEARQRIGEVAGDADVPADLAMMAAALADLERRQQAHAAAAVDARDAAADRRRAGEGIAEAEHARAALFARLDLAADEAARVAALCVERSGYLVACRARDVAAAHAERAEARLRGLAGFDDEWLEMDPGTLAGQRAEAETGLHELRRRNDEAVAIRTRIADAERKHDLESALAEVERREAELREARDDEVRGAVGRALVEHLQASTRDRHLPAVLRAARGLFARVTHGHYRLVVDDGESPAFRAVETATGRGLALDELSSATRIQLLLAVRIAFVETQEAGIRLPLVLDETLGNSDDERAEAIIDAVIELAAAGRQVLYFTAQPDEVAKWRGALAAREDVEHAVLDLAAARGRDSRLGGSGLRTLEPPRRAVPPPAGRAHGQYAAILGVPRLDPFASADAVHLWYLVDDCDALHHLLDRVRAEHWGALRTLVENGGSALVDPALFGRCAALARALDRALDLRRVGRGRPVDRTALEASGAITPAFIDRVAALCVEVGGCARALLDALRNGAIARFRGASTDALAEFLEAEGHLDLRDPLPPDAVRVDVLAAVADRVAEGDVSVDDLHRLLDRIEAVLEAGAGGASSGVDPR